MDDEVPDVVLEISASDSESEPDSLVNFRKPWIETNNVFRTGTVTTFHAYVTAIVLTISEPVERQTPKPSLFPTIKPRFEDVTAILSDSDFSRAFRMSRTALNALREIIERSNHLKPDTFGDRIRIPTPVKLAIGIRIMSGASFHDLMVLYGVSETSVRRCFKQFLTAVLDVMSLPGLPKNEEGLRHLEFGFKTSRRIPNPLSGCIEALDGHCVKIRKPPNDENPSSFYCRKGYYSIPVQALVGSDYRFLDFSSLAVGSTNDALAFSISPLARHFDEGNIPLGYYAVCDAEYTFSNFCLTPYPGKDIDAFKDALNFFTSSMRIHVEQAFGILTGRWKIFRNGEINYSVKDCVNIIAVGMILNNNVMDSMPGNRYVYNPHEINALQTELDDWHSSIQSIAPPDLETDREVIREKLREILVERGLLRLTSNL